MAEKHINYLKRDFNSIKSELINHSKQNYPQLSDNFGNDSSISSWFIDLMSDCVDSLNYHIDRVFQNTQLNSTSSRSALMNIARSNGLKVPGPKAGVCEVKFSCILPAGYYNKETNSTDMSMPNWNAAPIIQRNCVVSAGNYQYTIDENVDFAEAFNSDAYSNRTYVPRRNANGQVTGYTVSKTVLATAGSRKVYKKMMTSSDVEPFMEILLPEKDVMCIDSIIFKPTSDISVTPQISEYYVDEEQYQFQNGSLTTYRFFETESLTDQWRWGTEINHLDDRLVSDKYNPEVYDDYTETYWSVQYSIPSDAFIGATLSFAKAASSTVSIAAGKCLEITDSRYAGVYKNTYASSKTASVIVSGIKANNAKYVKISTELGNPNASQRTTRIYKGKWKPLRQKFITEYTDNGYMKIIFGPGVDYSECPSDATTYTQYRMSSLMNNDMMGVLPKIGWTMFVLYTTGGGVETNIAAGAINTISSYQIDFPKADSDAKITKQVKSDIMKSMSVTNTTNGVTGKDAPSNEELKFYIKYNTGAQNRCVTAKDYKIKVMDMPPKYGAPFRCAAMEENNKVVLSVLNINSAGQLYKALPSTLVDNMVNYLSHYKSINDYVEIKSAKIYNIGFLIDAFIDKSYNSADVVSSMISKVRSYMDINNQEIGEDIFLGDLYKEIGQIDGVISLISLKAYKINGGGYSSDICPLPSKGDVSYSDCNVEIESAFTIDGATVEQIDLDSIDSVLTGDANAMYEVKNPNDIQIRIKQK